VDEDLVGGRVATQHQHMTPSVVFDDGLGEQAAVAAGHHLVRTDAHVAPVGLLTGEELAEQLGHSRWIEHWAPPVSGATP
jgi:hypothetical protein